MLDSTKRLIDNGHATKALDILLDMRASISHGWTQFAYARNEHGVTCDESSPDAASFCLSGALWRERASLSISLDDGILSLIRDLYSLLEEITGGPIPVFNDRVDRTQQEVLDVIDKAIKEVSGG